MNVLLVDDNEADRVAVREAFAAACKEAVLSTAATGEQALEVLDGSVAERAQLPDILLLDLNLPGLHGLDLLQIVRNHPRWKGLPVLILSTSTSPDEVRQCYDMGANCYLAKPMRFTELVALVRSFCGFWGKVVLPRPA